jgi:hypothetical protein
MEEDFKIKVLEKLAVIESKLEDFSNLRNKVDVAYNTGTQNEKEIAELKEKNKWLARTVAGAIIVGIVGMYLNLVKIGG